MLMTQVTIESLSKELGEVKRQLKKITDILEEEYELSDEERTFLFANS